MKAVALSVALAPVVSAGGQWWNGAPECAVSLRHMSISPPYSLQPWPKLPAYSIQHPLIDHLVIAILLVLRMDRPLWHDFKLVAPAIRILRPRQGQEHR